MRSCDLHVLGDVSALRGLSFARMLSGRLPQTQMSGGSLPVARDLRLERELDGKARYAQTGGGCKVGVIVLELDGFCAEFPSLSCRGSSRDL